MSTARSVTSLCSADWPVDFRDNLEMETTVGIASEETLNLPAAPSPALSARQHGRLYRRRDTNKNDRWTSCLFLLLQSKDMTPRSLQKS